MFWKSCCIATFYCPCLCFERVVFSLTLRHLCPCLEAFLLLTVGNVYVLEELLLYVFTSFNFEACPCLK